MKGIREVMDARIFSGRSWDDVAKQCEAHTDKDFYKVRRLVRSEMAQASVDAEIAELEELGYGEYEVHCTLDEVMCEICGQYDGEVFKVGDTAHLPTYHPNCRCYITPVTDGKGSRSARDVDGKSTKIPANTTFNEWREDHHDKLEMKMRKFNEDMFSSNNVREASVMEGWVLKNLYKPIDMTQWRKLSVAEGVILNKERVKRYTKADKLGIVHRDRANDPRVKNVADMHAYMEQLHKDGIISDEDISAVRSYTGTAARKHINPLFRNIDSLSEELARKRSVPFILRKPNMIRSLDKVISKSRNINAMTLYRGTSLEEIGLDLNNPQAIVGKSWFHQAYLSASIDKGVANSFAGKKGVVIRIIVPPSEGKVALVEQWSMKPNQREAIIQRGSRYWIKQVGYKW